MAPTLDETHLLWDATRGFLLSKVLGGPIDVHKVRDGLAIYLRYKGEPDDWRTHLFTPLDEKNVGQVKYIDTFKNAMPGPPNPAKDEPWVKIHDVQPWEVDATNPLMNPEGKPGPKHLSFSTRIAFFLGAYWSGKRPRRVMLMTDCFDLAEPVTACVAAGIPVTLVWFGMYLDARWNSVMKPAGVDFYDLSMIKGVVVNKPSIEAKRSLNPY